MSMIQVKTITKNGENAPLQLDTQSGQAVHLQAQSGDQFQLIDESTQFGPENIAVKRVGNDLHIAFEGQTIDQPGLVIDGYYSTHNNSTNNLVVGLHENGNIYPYVPESAEKADAIYALTDGAVSNEALGGEITTIAAFVPPAVPLWAWGALGLLALGGIAAAAGGKGGGHDSNEADPSVSLSGIKNINEGEGSAHYTVSLDKASQTDTTVTVTLSNGTTDQADFTTGDSYTVTIPAGQTKENLEVGINDDEKYEGGEEYTMTITNVDSGKATISSENSVTTTIWDNGTTDGTTPGDSSNNSNNDYPTVSLSKEPANVNEGVGKVTYTVNIDHPSKDPVTVTYQVNNDNTNSGDFEGATTGTVTIPAGETEAAFTIGVSNDLAYEGPETYQVKISDPKNADLGNDSATTTIWDNGTIDGTKLIDPNNTGNDAGEDNDTPTISIAQTSTVNEAIGTVEYSLTLDKNTDVASKVSIKLDLGNAEITDFTNSLKSLGADNNVSYDAKTGMLTVEIPAGTKANTPVKFSLPIDHSTEENLAYEGKETYNLTISDANNLYISSTNNQVSTTIVDDGSGDNGGHTPADDRTISLNIDNPIRTITEGETTTGKIHITSDTSPVSVTFTFTENGKSIEKTIGVNQLLNSSEEYPLAVGEGKVSFNITGYDSHNGAIDFSYHSDAQNHSSSNSLVDNIKVSATLSGGKTSDTKDITITIEDTAPTAANDNLSLNEHIDTGTGNVLSNDTQNIDSPVVVDGIHTGTDAAFALHEMQATGSYGSIEINTDGSYTYNADSDKIAALKLKDGDTAIDTFTYEIKDADGDTATAQLNISIKGQNDAPIANDSNSAIIENAANKANIQLSAKDPEDDNLTYQIDSVSAQPASDGTTFSFSKNGDGYTIINNSSGVTGELTLNAQTGEISIKENPNGASVFDTLPQGKTLDIKVNFTASDGKLSDSATQTITVNGVNDNATIDGSHNYLDLSVSNEKPWQSGIGDSDTEEAYIRALNIDLTNGKFSSIKLNSREPHTFVKSLYGQNDLLVTHDSTSEYRNNTIHITSTIDKNNAAIIAAKALGKDTLTLYDYANFTSIDGTTHSLSFDNVSPHTTIYNTGSTDTGIAVDKTDTISGDYTPSATPVDENNIISTDNISNANIHTENGDDVIVVSQNISDSTIDLGIGDDYFYATAAKNGEISQTTIKAGDGNDLISLSSDVEIGEQVIIEGGKGTDTLILGSDAQIDGTHLSIKGIEIIDTRYGGENHANEITITGEQLAANGVTDVYLLAGDKGDTVNIKGFTDNGDHTYSYTDNATGTTYTLHDELNIGSNGFIV